MVIRVFIVLSVISCSLVSAAPEKSTVLLERHCLSCHQKLPMSLQRMFMRYLLVYGGEKNVKAGLKHYLQYPSKDISVMSKLFIENYGIKGKTHLDKETLDRVIDEYWETFKVIGRLK